MGIVGLLKCDSGGLSIEDNLGTFIFTCSCDYCVGHGNDVRGRGRFELKEDKQGRYFTNSFYGTHIKQELGRSPIHLAETLGFASVKLGFKQLHQGRDSFHKFYLTDEQIQECDSLKVAAELEWSNREEW